MRLWKMFHGYFLGGCSNRNTFFYFFLNFFDGIFDGRFVASVVTFTI